MKKVPIATTSLLPISPYILPYRLVFSLIFRLTFVFLLDLIFSGQSFASYVAQTTIYNLDTQSDTLSNQLSKNDSRSISGQQNTQETEKYSVQAQEKLNMQLLRAVKKLNGDNQNNNHYQDIKNALRAGADPLFKEKGSTIDVFHLFLMNRSKKALEYKSTEETFLLKIQ